MQAQVNRVAENLAKITQFVHEAKRKNVGIICFPELAVNGYNREKAHLTAEWIPGETSNSISNLAQSSDIIISVGIAEKNKTNKPYIAQITAFPDGRVEKYRKTHLGVSEKQYFSAGDDLHVFKDQKVKFGVQICWEMHFPEITTILSINGCELIFAPHASPITGSERREIWLKYLAARAYDNSVYVAACNLVVVQ